jgi:hypothetical protein
MVKQLIIALGFAAVFVAAIIGGEIGKKAGKTAFVSTPSQHAIEAELIAGFKQAEAKYKTKLPMMVDQDTRLDKMTVGPGVRVVYWYSFPKHRSRDINANDISIKLRSDTVRKVCASTGMKKSLQYGGVYVYSYFGSDDLEIAKFEVDRHACQLSQGFP